MTVTIRCIYEAQPDFPATDQHPDAVRYKVGDVWVDAIGGEPTQAEVDAVLAPPVPQSVTKRQAVQALILNGLHAAVEAKLAELPGIEGELARAEWRESNSVERGRPLVAQLGQQLGLTSEQLDDLFIQAAAL